MVGLGIPAGGTDNYATDLSSNGSTIVGFWDDSAGNEKAFHWTSTDGIVGIGSLPNQAHSEARAVSGDGLTIAGTGYWNAKAFRWTQSSGFLELGNLPGGNSSTANDISSDGLTIVGEGYFAGGGSHPFRWTSSDGMVDLISSGFQGGAANAASADGSVIVGTAYMGFNAHRAFRWTQATGLVDLGYIVGFGDHSASSVSADGSVIVGSGDLGEGVFYWTQAGGIRKLRDVLINDYGLNLSGWSLRSAGADKGPSISADGMTIVGTGTDPQGRTEAWIAHLPEPTTALLLTAGLLFRRRSSGGMGAWSYYLESNNRTAT
jgi:probable HAF family extracellular repeat protein